MEERQHTTRRELSFKHSIKLSVDTNKLSINLLTGLCCPIQFPPGLSDPTPLDFFVLSCLKKRINEEAYDIVEASKTAIK